jgi:hypothetical protein
MYRILCDRSPARELGSGLTWLKNDGRIIVEFSTTEEAAAKAKELNERRTVGMKYTAREYDPDGNT